MLQKNIMKNKNYKFAFSLVETLVVTAIITVLIAMVAGIAARVETQRKETLLKEAFADINTALQHFADFDYRYEQDRNYYSSNQEYGFYTSLKFPVDCNDFPNQQGNTLGIFLLTMPEVLGTVKEDITVYKIDQNGNVTVLPQNSAPYKEFAGSEALYYFLNQVPECQRILNRINPRMITNRSEDDQLLYIKINGISQPLFRFVDPWDKAIKYDYYNELAPYTYYTGRPREKSIKSFPTLTSAGPDGEFGTLDDIKSRN